MGTVTYRRQNALDLVVEQHDRIEQLLESIANEQLIERKQFLFDDLVAVVTAHATMEETLLYPQVRAVQSQDILELDDHVAIRGALRALVALEVDSDRFDIMLAVLAEEIRQHAREDEEQVLFPQLRRLMSEEQLVSLGIDMSVLFDRLMAVRVGSDVKAAHRDAVSPRSASAAR